MKNKLLLLLITISLVACKPDNEPIPEDANYYYYLTAEQIAKTPYFINPKFDTITFTSNDNDTLSFRKLKVDTSWYTITERDCPDCRTNRYNYQQLHITYQTIKGNGSFGVLHSKQGNAFNIFLSDFLKISISDQNFYINDYFIGVKHSRSIDSLVLNDYSYKVVSRMNNNWLDSNSSISYINKEFGIFYFNFLKNNESFNLIH